jgi:hypothetical protein
MFSLEHYEIEVGVEMMGELKLNVKHHEIGLVVSGDVGIIFVKLLYHFCILAIRFIWSP